MCGVAGSIAPPGAEPDRTRLGAMADALAHRGPDDAGIEVVGAVGLAHRRLAIVDPGPAGRQPMASPDGGWWVTYNGEVFNHHALRRALAPRPWVGHSDTETLVHMLAERGLAALAQLNGLFAFGALDRARGRVLLVRDRFGVKPLYYAVHDGEIVFASEIRALLAAGVPARPRRDVLAHVLVHGWANGPVTPIEGVSSVLPGHVVEIDLASLSVRESPWYDPAAVVDGERLARTATQGRTRLAGAVERELRASVRRRLMSDVPLGTMCSGGVDSSLVTAYARDEQPGVVAYNAAIADQPAADEGPWATRVTRALGVELRTVEVTAARWRADLVECVAHNEYPLLHESSVPMYAIARLAREDGVKVLLSGEGADELFGGYGYLHLDAHLRYLRERRGVGSAVALAAAKLRRDGARRGLAALGAHALGHAGSPAAAATLARVLGGDGGLPAEAVDTGALLPGACAQAAQYELGVRERAAGAYAGLPPATAALQAELLSELSTYLPHLLNRQDKNTMQASIETRVPFLDPGLVALTLNLPLSARVEPMRKGVLRDLAARRLPMEIVRRPKLGFGFDAGAYLRPAARPEFLLEGRLRDLLEVPAGPWRATVAGADSPLALRLWTGEIWCRLIAGGESRRAVVEALWKTPGR